MKKIVTIIAFVLLAGFTVQAQNGGSGPDNGTASKLSVKAYPNPARTVIYISLDDAEDDGPVIIKITDLLGNEVYINENVDISKILEIDIEKLGLVSGIYIIKAQHRGKSSMRKVVVQN